MNCNPVYWIIFRSQALSTEVQIELYFVKTLNVDASLSFFFAIWNSNVSWIHVNSEDVQTRPCKYAFDNFKGRSWYVHIESNTYQKFVKNKI